MSATAVQWIPTGFHTLTPYLHPSPEAKLIDFLKNAFGAVENFRAPRPDGTVMHAQLKIGDSIIELGEVPANEPSPKGTPLRTYVHSVDETYRRALDAGAVSLYEPVDQSYGDREAAVEDPAGNYWFIARPAHGDSYKHAGLQDVAPYLFPRDAAAYIDFLKNAFGAEELGRHPDAHGVILHADMKFGDSIVGMGQAKGRWQTMPAGLHYFVPDVDAVYRRALAAGAKSATPPGDRPYGERGATVIDPDGNYWYLATRISNAG